MSRGRAERMRSGVEGGGEMKGFWVNGRGTVAGMMEGGVGVEGVRKARGGEGLVKPGRR